MADIVVSRFLTAPIRTVALAMATKNDKNAHTHTQHLNQYGTGER